MRVTDAQFERFFSGDTLTKSGQAYARRFRLKVESGLREVGLGDVVFADEAVEAWMFVSMSVAEVVARFREIVV